MKLSKKVRHHVFVLRHSVDPHVLFFIQFISPLSCVCRVVSAWEWTNACYHRLLERCGNAVTAAENIQHDFGLHVVYDEPCRQRTSRTHRHSMSPPDSRYHCYPSSSSSSSSSSSVIVILAASNPTYTAVHGRRSCVSGGWKLSLEQSAARPLQR